MRLGSILVLAVATAAAVVAAAHAGPRPGRVTQTSIAGLRLGLGAGAYARALGERPFLTRFSNGTARLSFAKAELNVYLGRSGRGVRITTAAPEYTLGRGLGPCGSLSSLARARRLSPVGLAGPFGASAVVYRTGRLWFTLADPTHVGTVTLAAAKPDLKALIGEAQCGAGAEEGE